MAAELSHIEIKGVSVPLIYEKGRIAGAVNVQLCFEGAGIVADTIPGLAALSAKLLNEGSKRLGSVGFATELENRAISLNVTSGTETLVFDLLMLKEQQSKALSLLSELLSNPNLTKGTLEKIKMETKTSLLHKESDFDYIASTALNRRIFADTPLANPRKGSIEDVQKITLKDIQRFIGNQLLLERAIVLVGGDVELSEIKSELAPILALLPQGKPYEPVSYEVRSDSQVEYIKRNTTQAYIHFATPFDFSDFKEAYKAKVAAFVLGSSGFGSRMMEEIRVKRGLAYSAYWRINLHKSASYTSGYLQTKLENEKQAIAVVRELVAEFLDKGITQEELEGAKRFLLGSEPLRNETLNQRLGSAFSAYYRGLPLDYAKEELAKIAALSLEEINRYIKEHKELANLTFSVVCAP